MNTIVADAALWLWFNRPGIGEKRLRNWPSEVIVGVTETCREHDKRTAEPRTYTLEDMRKAYMAAWEVSGEGYNGEHGPFTAEGTPWAVERDEALARI